MDETWTLTVPAFTILTTDNPSFSVLLFYSRHGIDARHGIPRLGHDRDPGRAGSVSGIPGSHPFLHVLELCSRHSRDRCTQTGWAENSGNVWRCRPGRADRVCGDLLSDGRSKLDTGYGIFPRRRAYCRGGSGGRSAPATRTITAPSPTL